MTFLDAFRKLIFIVTAAGKITVYVIDSHTDAFKDFEVYVSVCEYSSFRCYCEFYLRSIRGQLILWEGGGFFRIGDNL